MPTSPGTSTSRVTRRGLLRRLHQRLPSTTLRLFRTRKILRPANGVVGPCSGWYDGGDEIHIATNRRTLDSLVATVVHELLHAVGVDGEEAVSAWEKDLSQAPRLRLAVLERLVAEVFRIGRPNG